MKHIMFVYDYLKHGISINSFILVRLSCFLSIISLDYSIGILIFKYIMNVTAASTLWDDRRILVQISNTEKLIQIQIQMHLCTVTLWLLA